MDVPSTTDLNPAASNVPNTVIHDEDPRHGHFAGAASQSQGPTALMLPTLDLPAPPSTDPHNVKSQHAWFPGDGQELDGHALSLRPSRLFKGKAKDEDEKMIGNIKRPLNLLDLPVDILKEIVKEVTHTNDLTSLALCHSALHHLTTPYIYSRFDIVWPDSSAPTESRSGVDALTYGLATLVMAEEIFGEAPTQRIAQKNRFNPQGNGRATETTIRRRRGNHYAQYTRKFSLGNGPAEWVNDYLISKEGGKMLCTLVALSVARMRSLETFIWDMPTGILRDVWLALSSLDDRNDEIPCRLEKVWVRWHDNSDRDAGISHSHRPVHIPHLPLTSSQGTHPDGLPMNSISSAALDRVEHPSFSVLPALKSLSVLDIDELVYLDEMAICIGKSLDKLRELRVGIAPHASSKTWVSVWEGDGLQQVDPDYPAVGSLTIGEKRLGGILGILTGFVCDMRKPRAKLPLRTKPRRMTPKANSIVDAGPSSSLTQPGNPSNRSSVDLTGIINSHDPPPYQAGTEQEDALSFDSPHAAARTALNGSTEDEVSAKLELDGATSTTNVNDNRAIPLDFLDDQQTFVNSRLQLEILELERVPLAVNVLQKSIDWSQLTSLTLLRCPNQDQLWKNLRRVFAPSPKSPTYPAPRRSAVEASFHTNGSGGKQKFSARSGSQLSYKLALKKIHTDNASPALIAFLKETLAPNSLEVLFLQEMRVLSNSVSLDAIYRGPLKRHRGSLKKVLIDSSEKNPDGTTTNSNSWVRWILTYDLLTFICGGNMPMLRELGIAMEYRYWHYFLQHLPSIPHLRSLYIPYLLHHVHGPNLEPRELALQLLDIVTLRPEVQLCYMGIANKCFEIMENRRDGLGRGASVTSDFALGMMGNGAGGHDGLGADGGGGGLPTSGGDEEWADDDDVDHGGDAEDDDDPDHPPHHTHHPHLAADLPNNSMLAPQPSHSHALQHHAPHDDDDVADDQVEGEDLLDDEEEEEEEEEDDDVHDHDHDDDDDSDFDGDPDAAILTGPRLRLREILFYDDKVAIFKARHGRL